MLWVARQEVVQLGGALMDIDRTAFLALVEVLRESLKLNEILAEELDFSGPLRDMTDTALLKGRHVVKLAERL